MRLFILFYAYTFSNDNKEVRIILTVICVSTGLPVWPFGSKKKRKNNIVIKFYKNLEMFFV